MPSAQAPFEEGLSGVFLQEGLPGEKRPEVGLLGLRKEMGLCANLRPARLLSALKEACPLRAQATDRGFDFLVVRELIGGVYFGKHTTEAVDGQLMGPRGFEELGRGNQQISAQVIGRVGKANILIAASKDKMLSLFGKSLYVDTGDEATNQMLCGYYKVIVGYEDSVMFRLSDGT